MPSRREHSLRFFVEVGQHYGTELWVAVAHCGEVFIEVDAYFQVFRGDLPRLSPPPPPLSVRGGGVRVGVGSGGEGVRQWIITRGDAGGELGLGEMYGRYTGDLREIYGRYRGAVR